MSTDVSATTAISSSHTLPNRVITRLNSASPLKGSSRLSRPSRWLAPPARTTPVTASRFATGHYSTGAGRGMESSAAPASVISLALVKRRGGISAKGEGVMAKYMVLASYTAEGTQGLLKEGALKRRAVVESLVQGLGGKLEAFYFAFGENDVVVISDVPDNVAAAAVSLAVNASGAVNARTIVLMTPEEMDQAAKMSVSYTAPGR